MPGVPRTRNPGAVPGFTASPPVPQNVYYFDQTAGSDANDGLTPQTAWKTLSKISVVETGETALLKRGERWRETLTIPHGRVTVGAYGADPVVEADGYCTNAPVIDGGDLLTGWSSYAGGVDSRDFVDAFTGTSGQNITAHSPNVGTSWVYYPNFGSSGMVISSTNTLRRSIAGPMSAYGNPGPGSADQYAQVKLDAKTLATGEGIWVYCRANVSLLTENFYYAQLAQSGTVRIAKMVLGASTVLGAGTLPWTPQTGQTLRLEVEGVDPPVLRVYLDGVLQISGEDTANQYIDPGFCGVRLGSNTAALGSDTTGYHADDFEYGPLNASGTPTNTYQATYAPAAELLDWGGHDYNHRGASMNNLLDGEWYQKSGVLYVRNDAGSPTNVSVATRANAVVAAGRTDVVVQDIAVEHTAAESYKFTSSPRATLRRCMAQRTAPYAVLGTEASGAQGVSTFQSGSDDAVIEDCVFRHCGSETVYMTASVRPTIRRNRMGPVYEKFSDILQIDASTGTFIGSIITDNYFTLAGSNTTKGIFTVFGDNHTVRRNVFVGGRWAMTLNGQHSEFTNNVCIDQSLWAFWLGNVTSDDHLVAHNVFVECRGSIAVPSPVSGALAVTNLRIIANTLVNIAQPPVVGSSSSSAAASPAQIDLARSTSGELTDNILWNASGSGLTLAKAAAGTLVSDYNLLGPERTGYVKWAGTLYNTLAALVAASGQDTHSISADPQLIEPGSKATDGSGQRPTWSSPVVGAGVLVPDIVLRPDIGALSPAPAQTREIDRALPITLPSAPIETLTDTFATLDTTKWNVFDTVTVAGGVLAVTPTQTYSVLQSNDTYSFGGGEAMVEVPAVPTGGDATTDTQMLLRHDVDPGNNFLGLLVEGSNLISRASIEGVLDDTVIPYDPVAHRWWRVRDSAGSVLWDTSPDGSTWTQQKSVATSTFWDLRRVRVELSSGWSSGDLLTPTDAQFDNFNNASVDPTVTVGRGGATAAGRAVAIAESAVISRGGATSAGRPVLAASASSVTRGQATAAGRTVTTSTTGVAVVGRGQATAQGRNVSVTGDVTVTVGRGTATAAGRSVLASSAAAIGRGSSTAIGRAVLALESATVSRGSATATGRIVATAWSSTAGVGRGSATARGRNVGASVVGAVEPVGWLESGAVAAFTEADGSVAVLESSAVTTIIE